jgi:hypothetical protein
MKNRNTRLRDIPHTRSSCLDLSHIVTLSTSRACVSVYSAVTRPSQGKGFGPVHTRLDMIWTRVGVGTSKFVPGVPLWGSAAGHAQA